MPSAVATVVDSPRRPRPIRLRARTAGDAHLIKKRRFLLYSYSADDGWTRHAPASSIDFENGQLFVDGIRIVNPRITADHVTWHQRIRRGQQTHYTVGSLHLHSNGYEADGTVAIGTHSGDAVSHAVFATTIPTVNYQTRITKQTYAAGTDPATIPDAGWQPGLALAISYTQAIGASIPSPTVSLGGQDISEQCSWSVDGDDTVVTISLSDSDCEFAGNVYQTARIAFSAVELNAKGHGEVQAVCGQPSAAGQVWLWRADPAPGGDLRASAAPPAPQRWMTAASELLSVADDDLTIGELITILPDDVVSQDANSMLMRNMKWAMGQDPTERDWLSRFFSEAPPVITEPDQQTLVNQSLDWYQKKFALAYLTQSFNSYSGPNEPSNRLSQSQAVKLTDYLKTGLAAESDFNVQHQGIFVDAYTGAKPRLQNYINDEVAEAVGWAQGSVVFARHDASKDVTVAAGTEVKTSDGIVYTTQAKVTLKAGEVASGDVPVAAELPGTASVVPAGALNRFGDQPPTGIDSVTNKAATTLSADSGGLKWAKKLFTALTTGRQYVLMVNRVAGAAGDAKALEPVNNFACLLTALDRSGTIARNYYRSIISGVVVKLVPQVVHRDKDTIMQWLPTAMQELLRKLANGELPNETDISHTEAVEMYEEYLQHSADIALATADLLQSIIASGLIRQAGQSEEEWQATIAARWPKLAKAGRFMLALGWIGGVSSVIVSLVRGDWNKMTDVERAEFVTNIVQLTVVGFDAVPLIWQGVKFVTLKIWNALNDYFNAPKMQSEIEMQEINIADEETPLLEQEADNINQIYEVAQVERTTLGEGTIFERLFADGVFTGVLKSVGAIAAAAMAGYSLWQLIDDIKSRGSVSTIVFDSLIFAANFLAAVCLVADLFAATSFLPIAGAVLAIVGIVLTVLAGFFEKPDNPVDDWMVEHGMPFVDGLPGQKAAPVNALRLQLVIA